MSARTENAAGDLCPLVVLLINALANQEHQHRRGDAKALRAFGELALVQVPSHGVFAPAESELYTAIDQIATKHLGFDEPRKAFFDATAGLKPFAKRDEIESAANHMRSASDRAYFYVGLAFGVTFAELREIR